MSSSSSGLRPLPTPELRTGEWTRFGSERVLGDAVTEHALSTLAETTRAAARSQGYSVGWAEGQRRAREEAAADATRAEQEHVAREDARVAEHAAALHALAVASDELRAATARVCAAVEHQASELAWELTRELVGHELSIAAVDVVRRVLTLLPNEPVVAVRLHPDDLAGAVELADRGIALVPDPALRRGDALVEAADHVLDLRLDLALGRVRDALLEGGQR
ncbi:MAG: FliH/SctL family protein [Marmoricola sp.]